MKFLLKVPFCFTHFFFWGIWRGFRPYSYFLLKTEQTGYRKRVLQNKIKRYKRKQKGSTAEPKLNYWMKPLIKRMTESWFYTMLQKLQLFHKSCSGYWKVWLKVIKNECITRGPDCPAYEDYCFHEELGMNSILEKDHSVREFQGRGNIDPNELPALLCKLTLQKEMMNWFLCAHVTENTTVWWQEHVLSFLNISCTQSVFKQ